MDWGRRRRPGHTHCVSLSVASMQFLASRWMKGRISQYRTTLLCRVKNGWTAFAWRLGSSDNLLQCLVSEKKPRNPFAEY